MRKLILIAASLVAFSAVTAMATFTNLAPGGFGSEIYDIAVNRILMGPIGFVCGLLIIGCAGCCAVCGKPLAGIPCVLAGAAILNADSLVTSLGTLI